MIEVKKLIQEEKDVLDFIRVALLRPEQIDVLLPQLIQSVITDPKSRAEIESIHHITKK